VAVVFTILNAFIFRVDEVRNPHELSAVERQRSANVRDPPDQPHPSLFRLFRRTSLDSSTVGSRDFPDNLMLRIPGYEKQNAKLMFFLVLVVQLSDVLQYVWGKSIGKRPIAPSISPNKTWEGLVGGIVCATAIGTAIAWATPFAPGEAALMALILTMMGFAGGLIMSAIKRDRGVKDYGSLIEGHGGVLDRIDSLCFAAPVFFHLTRYFYIP
jgi:CDP-diglyceride synthetase